MYHILDKLNYSISTLNGTNLENLIRLVGCTEVVFFGANLAYLWPEYDHPAKIKSNFEFDTPLSQAGNRVQD